MDIAFTPRKLFIHRELALSRTLLDGVSSNSSSAASLQQQSNGGHGSVDPVTFGSPFMVIVFLVLTATFLCMGVFTYYVRRYTEILEERGFIPSVMGDGGPSRGRFRGLDAPTIDKLPLIVYSSASASNSCSSKYNSSQMRHDDIDEAAIERKLEKLKKRRFGAKRKLDAVTECVVCLGDFQEYESLKLLPVCQHYFHPECINMWLFSHKTCPLCRQPVVTSLVPVSDSVIGENNPEISVSRENSANRNMDPVRQMPFLQANVADTQISDIWAREQQQPMEGVTSDRLN